MTAREFTMAILILIYLMATLIFQHLHIKYLTDVASAEAMSLTNALQLMVDQTQGKRK